MADGNSVSDEIKAQHKKLAGKTPKEKFQYFWEYYRIPTLVTILVAAFAANLIYTIVTAKDSALSVLFINGYSEMDTEAFMSGFDEYAQIDTKEYSTSLEMNFTIQEEATDQYTMQCAEARPWLPPKSLMSLWLILQPSPIMRSPDISAI
ncbi:MAG: hypothetical protein ACLUOI_15555 [Eisenbergiella sp.]